MTQTERSTKNLFNTLTERERLDRCEWNNYFDCEPVKTTIKEFADVVFTVESELEKEVNDVVTNRSLGLLSNEEYRGQIIDLMARAETILSRITRVYLEFNLLEPQHLEGALKTIRNHG